MGDARRRSGKEPSVIECISDEQWPVVASPLIPSAKLPLEITFVQLMSLIWVRKGLVPDRRPLSPALPRAIERTDYHLATMEIVDNAAWRKLKWSLPTKKNGIAL